jgi:hypothetical protein
MTLSSMFLRTDCVLPDRMGLLQRRFGKRWMSVEDATAVTLDVQLRNAGWHFICLQVAHSRVGIGRTAESAASKAMTRALTQIEQRFNAAELGQVKATRCPGWQSQFNRFGLKASLLKRDKITYTQTAVTA